jgi:hypothetical protein
LDGVVVMKLYKEYTSCDCSFERLVQDDDKIILEGDYYHDKINYQIKGYLAALVDYNIEYSFEKRKIECPYCNDEE